MHKYYVTICTLNYSVLSLSNNDTKDVFDDSKAICNALENYNLLNIDLYMIWL